MNRWRLHLPLLILTALALPAANSTDSGRIQGKVVIANAEHNGNAVLYLEKVEGDRAQREAKSHRMWQKNKRFTPPVLVVQKGDEVEFPNGDKLFHNVFSVSRPARFDLGLYKSGQSKTVKFKRTGVVDVYCNIHPQMVGKVLIVPNRYYVQTDKDGQFSLENVPPGTYDLVAWHPHAKSVEQEVTVAPGDVATVAVKLKTGRSEDSHVRKDGTPYGRYE